MEKNAYDEAISSGKYEQPSGLIGKYDNVRRFWEDEVIGIFLSPYLEQLVVKGNKLRILDLGCGSGDGYDLLMAVKRKEVTPSEHNVNVIDPELIDTYKGVDINPTLIAQANAIHGSSPGVAFEEVDFNHLPPEFNEEPPYDLYFAAYGTMSHNTDDETIKLLSHIAKHSRDGSIILCDWLGRYSYEWQPLWTKDMEQNKTIDYLISYIYSDGKKEKGNGKEEEREVTSFPLRLLSSQEMLAIIEQSSREARVEMKLKESFDRSIFMGRHIDTAQYNPHCKPVRGTLNSLLEPNIRTNLEELIIDYVPKDGFPELNEFYQNLERCWNALVRYTMELVQHFDGEGKVLPPTTDAPTYHAAGRQEPALKKAMLEMERVVESASGLSIADARANIIEPQLCYSLRELEMEMQKGKGCGHGLVAILQVHK